MNSWDSWRKRDILWRIWDATALRILLLSYVAEKVCQEIINSGYQKHGVLICGTGLGMAMTANKFKHPRRRLHDIFSAERLKLSNDGNVICMGERVIGTELAKRILEKWLELDFVDCASTSKVEAIKEIEGENLK